MFLVLASHNSLIYIHYWQVQLLKKVQLKITGTKSYKLCHSLDACICVWEFLSQHTGVVLGCIYLAFYRQTIGISGGIEREKSDWFWKCLFVW